MQRYNRFVEIPSHVLDDLCCRFIINIPEQEKTEVVRICFQIEQAHWFYLDFYSKNNGQTLKHCSFHEFARNIFGHIDYLQPYLPDLDQIINDFKGYKYSVPTYGAIIIDEYFTHVLLVRSYCAKASWGFPKGKINKDELPSKCAIREVFEETGFDIEPKLNPNNYIEIQMCEQTIRLYIIPEVSRATKFYPQTRNEIKEIRWFPINTIPIRRIKIKHKRNCSFHNVYPFMRELKIWLFKNGKFKSYSNAEDDGAMAFALKPIEGDIIDCSNEIECYDGSDEDDRGNDEIYGIPKAKTLKSRCDSGDSSCSAIIHNGSASSNDSPDACSSQTAINTSDHSSQVAKYTKGFNGFSKLPLNHAENSPFAKISNYKFKYVDCIEKEIINSADKNLVQKTTRNAAHDVSVCTDLFENMSISPTAAKPMSQSDSKAPVENIALGDLEQKLIPFDYTTEPYNYPLIFNKEEFRKKLSENHKIRSLKNFKFNMEKLQQL